jgi:hypothetical protein
MRYLLALSLFGLAGCSGGGSSAFDYDALRDGLSAAEVRKLPPDKPLTCKVPTSGQGLSVCEVEVAQLDGLKATRVTYVFEDDELIAASIEYSPGAYAEVSKMLDKRFQHHPTNTTTQGTWKVGNGMVISSATELRHGNVYAYWLSNAEAAKAGAVW